MSAPATADNTSLKSTFYEQLVEHVFISEILQEIWYSFGRTAEVLRSEVDASGYDIVIECNGFLRHIQLKTSKSDAKAGGQKVNVALATKPSGCVIWMFRQENHDTRRMSLSYRFFGGEPGEKLPSLAKYKVAKHTKGNAEGRKNPRQNIKVVPRGRFGPFLTTRELVERLFGLRAANAPAMSVVATEEQLDHQLP
jgi:hypothetical protein